MEAVKIEYRRNLTHRQPIGGTFFVTFRLAGTLPLSVWQQYERESAQRQRAIRQAAPPDLPLQLYREEKRRFARFDRLLDQGLTDVTYLQNPELATIVRDGIHHFDGRSYELLAYTIMPNHVHLLVDFSPQLDAPSEKSYQQLYHLLKVLKGYTAYRCNRVLNKQGTFWQRESYDHLVRDARELQNVVAYILENPVKAGLVTRASDWPFSYRQT
jgi:putative transposase